MSFEAIILREHNLICSYVYGNNTDLDMINGVKTLNEKAADLSSCLEIVCTLDNNIGNEITPEGFAQSLALESNQPRIIGGRLAIITSIQNRINALQYTKIAASHRDSAEVFDNFDDAIEWIGLEDQKELIIKEFNSLKRKHSYPEYRTS
jgi:hypothetical protein